MSSLNDHSNQLVRVWAAALAGRLSRPVVSIVSEGLNAYSFSNEQVRIEFPDESCVQFEYAFALVDEGRSEVAVFTEHCGHHVFSRKDATILIDGKILMIDAD